MRQRCLSLKKFQVPPPLELLGRYARDALCNFEMLDTITESWIGVVGQYELVLLPGQTRNISWSYTG